MLRARRGKTIPDLIKLTESITNNNYNRITKKTANQSVSEEKKSEDIQNYNKKRQVAGKDLKKLEVGEYVRIRLLKTQKQKGLAYKSYKNMLWSGQVYRVTGKTNKKPHKYRVKGKWTLKSMLMKSAPVDVESEKIIESRTEKTETRKKKAKLEHIKEIERRNLALLKSKRPRRIDSRKGRARKLAAEKHELYLDDILGPMSD